MRPTSFATRKRTDRRRHPPRLGGIDEQIMVASTDMVSALFRLLRTRMVTDEGTFAQDGEEAPIFAAPRRPVNGIAHIFLFLFVLSAFAAPLFGGTCSDLLTGLLTVDASGGIFTCDYYLDSGYSLDQIYALALPLNGTGPSPGDPFGVGQHDPAGWLTVTQQPILATAQGYPGHCTSIPAGERCYIFSVAVAQDLGSGENDNDLGIPFNRVAFIFITSGNDGQPASFGERYYVGQHSANCTFAVRPSPIAYGPSIKPGTLTITAIPNSSATPLSACSWTASSATPWITAVTPSAGSGNGTVSFKVAASNTSSHTGTITVAGQTVTVNEQPYCQTLDDVGGAVSLSPNYPSAGGMEATFELMSGTIEEMANICGFEELNWQQTVTSIPTPLNPTDKTGKTVASTLASLCQQLVDGSGLSFACMFSKNAPTQPLQPPFADPVAGGYVNDLSSITSNRYPYYYNTLDILTGTFCALRNTVMCLEPTRQGQILIFYDQPNNPILLPDLWTTCVTVPASTLPCFSVSPLYFGARTTLVGVLEGNVAGPKLYEWNWKTTFAFIPNIATAGSVFLPSNSASPNPSGTGRVTITDINGISVGSPNSNFDFNGDSKSDVFLYDPIGGNGYAGLSNGTGAFDYVYLPFTPGFSAIRYGKFTSNSYSDLIAYNSTTALGYALLGTGSGAFNAVSLFLGPGFATIATRDINGDGLTDLVMYRPTDGTMYTAISNGDGTFRYQYTLVNAGYTNLQIADFNGDGKADIFLYRSGDGLAYMGLSNGSGGFTFSPIRVGGGYDFIETGDVDGDGKADLLFYSSSTGAAYIGTSTGSGFNFSPLVTSAGFTSVRMLDYNGDGFADIIFYNQNNTLGYLLIGNGTGTFTGNSLFWGAGMQLVEVGDLNGDGKSDVVIYDTTNAAAYTGLNTGNVSNPFTYTYSYWGIGRVVASAVAQP